MAASSVLLVQNSQHLLTHLLGSQKYDAEGGLGRKFPRIMDASVLFIGPYLSPDLLLFLVWMQGLTWKWDQAHIRGERLGISCTWVPIQAPISVGALLRLAGTALPSSQQRQPWAALWAAGVWLECHTQQALQVWAHATHQLLLCTADLHMVCTMGIVVCGSQAYASHLQRETAVIHTSCLPNILTEHHVCFKMQLFKPIQLICKFLFKICKYTKNAFLVHITRLFQILN